MSGNEMNSLMGGHLLVKGLRPRSHGPTLPTP